MSIFTMWHSFQDWFARLSVGPGTRAEIFEALADQLMDGKPLVRALEELEGIYSDDGKRPGNASAMMLSEARHKIAAGLPIAVALGDWVGPEEKALLAAGSIAGELPTTLKEAAEIASVKARLASKAMMVLPYPALLLALTCFILAQVAYRVVPPLEKIVPHESWEGSGALLYYVTFFVTRMGLPVLALLLAAAIFCIWSLPRTLSSDVRYRLDFLPPWSLYKRLQGAMFFTAFSTLLRAGIKMDDALAVIASSGTPYLRQRVQAIGMALVGGSGFGAALNTTGYLFPTKRSIQIARMYDESKDFTTAISKLAAREVKAVDEALSASIGLMLAIVLILNTLIAALVALGTQSIISAVPGV